MTMWVIGTELYTSDTHSTNKTKCRSTTKTLSHAQRNELERDMRQLKKTKLTSKQLHQVRFKDT